MEKSFVENGFIIDLSTTKNTTQLVFELSSIMEHPDVKEKNICLKYVQFVTFFVFLHQMDEIIGRR